jgi:hypothetical protein
MIEDGRFASLRELAEAERVSLSYISGILHLVLLATGSSNGSWTGAPHHNRRG